MASHGPTLEEASCLLSKVTGEKKNYFAYFGPYAAHGTFLEYRFPALS
jgi:hypothetical protein